jgi:N utilization substance protein A
VVFKEQKNIIYSISKSYFSKFDTSLNDFFNLLKPIKGLEEFKKIGLDSAKDVLRTSVEDLLQRTDLEEETIVQVQKI